MSMCPLLHNNVPQALKQGGADIIGVAHVSTTAMTKHWLLYIEREFSSCNALRSIFYTLHPQHVMDPTLKGLIDIHQNSTTRASLRETMKQLGFRLPSLAVTKLPLLPGSMEAMAIAMFVKIPAIDEKYPLLNENVQPEKNRGKKRNV